MISLRTIHDNVSFVVLDGHVVAHYYPNERCLCMVERVSDADMKRILEACPADRIAGPPPDVEVGFSTNVNMGRFR